MLERSHLAIIRAVDQFGTLTEAAEHLCLTQSALSHAIKKFEQQVGIKVWDKEGRNLRLTQAGEYLLSLSNRVLPQLQHAEQTLHQFAQGRRGSLRIGMECHPCYQWLLTVVAPFLTQWPDVEVDVKQRFQFCGMAALQNYEIDVLITPDPVELPTLIFTPVFAYELVLVVAQTHALAQQSWVTPQQVAEQALITYPVARERLDVFSQFLTPAQCEPQRHQRIEATDIMLHMTAAGRGVTVLPHWLLQHYAHRLPLKALRLGEQGIHKHIYTGIRHQDADVAYIQGFCQLATSC